MCPQLGSLCLKIREGFSHREVELERELEERSDKMHELEKTIAKIDEDKQNMRKALKQEEENGKKKDGIIKGKSEEMAKLKERIEILIWEKEEMRVSSKAKLDSMHDLEKVKE